MPHCLDKSSIEEIGESFLTDFDRRILAIPEDMCAPFNQEARQLETELVTAYKFVAQAARKDESMEKVAELWGAMVALCDSSILRLAKLKQNHPLCEAGYYYDRICDLKNKCQRLQTLHS
jgi:hypothetical protein